MNLSSALRKLVRGTGPKREEAARVDTALADTIRLNAKAVDRNKQMVQDLLDATLDSMKGANGHGQAG